MASTGFKREAEYAGIKPETNPIKKETLNPSKILPKDNASLKSKAYVTKSVPANIINNPTIPPIIESITASKRNCNNMK